MHIQSFKESYSHKSFSDVLNYFTIQNDTIYHDNGDITGLINAPIAVVNDESVLSEINKRMCDFFEILPIDAEMQFYYTRAFDNSPIIVRGGPPKRIVHFLNKAREDYYNSTVRMTTAVIIAITIKNKVVEDSNKGNDIKDKFSSFFKKGGFKYSKQYVLDKQKTLDGTIDKLVKLYTDSKGSAVSNRLADIEIVRFFSLLINHVPDTFSQSIDDIFNGDVVFNRKEGNYYYNGQYHAFLSMWKKGVPKTMKDDFLLFLFSEEISSLPFTVFNCVRFADKEKELDNIQNMRSFSQSLLGAPGFQKQKLRIQQEIANFEEIEFVCRDEHYRIVELSWSVHLWAESPEKLQFMMNQFHTLASGNGFRFTQETFNITSIYRSMFPGLFIHNEIRFKMMTGNSRALLPIISTPTILPNPKSQNLVYFFNRFGDIVRYDPFDSRCPNWNFCIVGGSGSGKSFFTNQLLFQQLPSNPKIFIVDKGGSYRRLIENLGGTYIAVDYEHKANFSINIFDGPYSAEKEIFLIALLEQMIVDKASQYISKSFKAIFQQLITQAYDDTNNNENDVLNLEIFVDNYMRMNTQTKSLCPPLEMYIHDGSYASFFRKTKIAKTYDYVCFDLDALGNNNDLMPILALAIVNLIWQSITTDLTRRKVIVIDEAWAALKDSSGLSAFIDELYRTARKHNGCVSLVTQSLSDILRTSLGAGIKTNTSFFYILKTKDDAQTLVQIEDINQYTFEKKIKTLQMLKGQYSEVYMHCPGVYTDVLRVRPCMTDYWASTTDAGDKNKMADVTKRLENSLGRKPALEEIITDLIKS